MSVLPAVALIRPTDLAELLAVIDEDHVPYAGATELVPAMRLGVRRPEAIVDLKRVPSLRGIDVDQDAALIHIGAAMTHREISTSAAIRQFAPTLAAAVSRVGNARVRTSGTIGGNLCFAEPRSDLSTVLTALDATVSVVSADGRTSMTIPDLIVGAFETCLAPEQLLERIHVPFELAGTTYWKLQSFERPTIGVAVVPRAFGWTVVVGAATERPHRADIARDDPGAVDRLVDGVELSDDLAGSSEYKRAVLLGYLREITASPAGGAA